MAKPDLTEEGDLDEALNAARQIGDDAIQKRSQGYVVPESFNLGPRNSANTGSAAALKPETPRKAIRLTMPGFGLSGGRADASEEIIAWRPA